jgi:hypothetical protein
VTIVICEGCREVVVPGAPGVVRAAELVPVPTFGKPNEVLEGLHVHFHEECFVGEPYYRRVEA